MGWTPNQVRRESLWSFKQAFEGWLAFHCAKPEPTSKHQPPTEEQFLRAIGELP